MKQWKFALAVFVVAVSLCPADIITDATITQGTSVGLNGTATDPAYTDGQTVGDSEWTQSTAGSTENSTFFMRVRSPITNSPSLRTVLFLQFDVSSIGANQEVESATLTLTASGRLDTYTANMNMAGVTNAWDTGGTNYPLFDAATWDLADTGLTNRVATTPGDTAVGVDVKTYVDAWVSGAQTNNGLQLSLSVQNAGLAFYDTTMNGGVNQPKLNVVTLLANATYKDTFADGAFGTNTAGLGGGLIQRKNKTDGIGASDAIEASDQLKIAMGRHEDRRNDALTLVTNSALNLGGSTVTGQWNVDSYVMFDYDQYDPTHLVDHTEDHTANRNKMIFAFQTNNAAWVKNSDAFIAVEIQMATNRIRVLDGLDADATAGNIFAEVANIESIDKIDADGFSVEATFNADETFTVTIEGLSGTYVGGAAFDSITLSESLDAGMFATLFGSDTYMSATVHQPDWGSLVTLDADDTVYMTLENMSAIPEPATMSLLALGGMAMLRRRKK